MLFRSRTAQFGLFLPGPAKQDNEKVWRTFADALSVTGDLTEGTRVRLAITGLPAVDGVVEFADVPRYVGVRTDTALLILIKGYRDAIVLDYHGFSDEDEQTTAAAFRSWLDSSFG